MVDDICLFYSDIPIKRIAYIGKVQWSMRINSNSKYLTMAQIEPQSHNPYQVLSSDVMHDLSTFRVGTCVL